jgi:transglutaminase-like putative cysteine protease
MVRLKVVVELQYEIMDEVSDFIFNVHAAQTSRQSLAAEEFRVSQPVDVSMFTDPAHGNRYARLRAARGPLSVRYGAVIDITHHTAPPDSVGEVPVAQLPPEALAYLYPSRYCQSDRLRQLANNEFGALPPGYWRVQAIQDWVQRRTRFVPGSSNATTSAVDTVVEQSGVCRDFAHLMIALCRALNIPARFATGIDYGADQRFGPPDFHAYVEVFLDGRWYLFDPTGMTIPTGLIRLGTGRDAADVSFATIFGAVKSGMPVISIEGIEDADSGIALPRLCTDALSTDGAVFAARAPAAGQHAGAAMN